MKYEKLPFQTASKANGVTMAYYRLSMSLCIHKADRAIVIAAVLENECSEFMRDASRHWVNGRTYVVGGAPLRLALV